MATPPDEIVSAWLDLRSRCPGAKIFVYAVNYVRANLYTTEDLGPVLRAHSVSLHSHVKIVVDPYDALRGVTAGVVVLVGDYTRIRQWDLLHDLLRLARAAFPDDIFVFEAHGIAPTAPVMRI